MTVFNPYDCPHERKEIRRKVIRGGGVQYRYQCPDCGDTIGNSIKKVDACKNGEPKDWDSGLEERNQRLWMDYCSDRHQTYLNEQEDKDFDFWLRYSEHINSPKWKDIRAAVIMRARGVCEGCMKAKATQVHHKTYRNLGDEFLFELVALCDACHKRFHEKK